MNLKNALSLLFCSDSEELLEKLPKKVQWRVNCLGTYGLGETYVEGLWETKELDKFIFEFLSSKLHLRSRIPLLPLFNYLLRERILNLQSASRAFNIGRKHYDLGNDLFLAMLDKSMTYTCGYWENAKTLDEAQVAKLDLICKKLDLKPGQKVLDIGCGWGNFAKFAAKNYGVEVVGVTVSKEQARFAKNDCMNLPVDIRLVDYRQVNEKFDHIVSIEMIEAVGRKNLKSYYKVVNNCLKDDGKFLLQAISTETLSKHSEKKVDQFLMWILKYIFPDGYLPKMSELTYAGAKYFKIDHMQSFGPDYDKTLMSWSANFNEAWPDLENAYDEKFKRVWNFYLSTCAALFRSRMVHLYQIVYSKKSINTAIVRPGF